MVAPKTPWVRGKRTDLLGVTGVPLIVREKGSGSRWCLEQMLELNGLNLSDMDVVLELSSNEAIKEAVLEGLGGSIMSTLVVHKEVRARRLRAVAIDGLVLVRTLYLAWDRRRVLPIPAQHFLQFVVDTSI